MSAAATPDDLRLADSAARRLAQVEFERPMVLEAGAGTGKTTALVARVLAWCMGPGWEGALGALAAGSTPPDDFQARPDRVAARVLAGVVAITFTEAAAAEMSNRVGEALHALEAGELPQGLLDEVLPGDLDLRRVRARALRGALDHLVAQTIHAWCRRLLVTYPLDAGLHPELDVDADGRIRQEVVRELLEDRLRQGYATESPLLTLALRGVGPQELESQLLALLDAGFSAADFAADPLSEERLGELGANLRDAALALQAAHAGALHGVSRAKVSVATAECVDRLVERLAEAPLSRRPDLADLVTWLSAEFPENNVERVRTWGKGSFGKGEQEALGSAGDAVAAAAELLAALLVQLRSMDVALLDLGRQVFATLLAGVESELRARGVATFATLLTGADDLLTLHADVASRVRTGIDQLLVDEFQDTDRRQCAMVRTLALEGAPETRPGLFVVGDPKQSIYGWRSADLAAYDGFVSEVENAGGLLARLSVNYRSVPAILEEVERVIAPVMHASPGIQPEFQRLVASESRARESGYADARSAPVEYSLPAGWNAVAGEPVSASAREASRLEATALARELRRLHDDASLAWRSFGVLFRSRSDWDLYLGALRQAGIPFAVEGDRNYYRRREIVDASALVRCVLDPNDLVALVTLLRSAMLGVPDAALVPLWIRGFPGKILRLHAPDPASLAALRAIAHEVAGCLPAGIPGLERVAGWEHNLVAAVEAIAALRLSAQCDAADVFVEKMRLALLIEATESARYQGPWRGANLDRFFRDLLGDLDDGGDFHRVLRRLRSAVADELDAEEGRPREALEDAVQIMTIHGAKGLDFDHVYLMQCHKGSAVGRRMQVDCGRFNGRLEYRVLDAPTPGWHHVEAEREIVEEAERVRTLYVALTRARDRIVISGIWPSLHAQRRSGQATELLAARAGGAPDLPQEMARLAATGAAPFVDAAGVRWVFPGLEDDGASGPVEEGAGAASLPEVAAIEAASQILAAHARVAGLRMQRRLVGAATLDAHENADEDAEVRAGEGVLGVPAWRAEGDDGVARAMGTAVHRALEHFDFAGDLAAELAAARIHLARSIEGELAEAQREAGLERASALLRRFADGPLQRRLRLLADRIVARELAVLVAPASEEGPVACVTGAIDLVYRDPDSDALVIADYKTGARRDYSAQGAHYCRALRTALGLAYEPRFELWYLEEGEIVVA